ncbi:MAG: GGDEF domain-containing protein [Planctomycetes bacterium]|nr:GGDEF domain-containing protein [Planctomycetota bacterium]
MLVLVSSKVLIAGAALTLATAVGLAWFSEPGWLNGLLLIGGAWSASCAGVFAWDAHRVRRALGHLVGGGAALGAEAKSRAAREQRSHELLARMQRQVELLSAIRDLALIANDDVSFARILGRGLGVLGGFFGAREITVFLEAPNTEHGLEAVAHHFGGKTRVCRQGELGIRPIESLRAWDEQRTVLPEPGRGGLRAACLLVADGEVMGALEVRLPPDQLERDLSELGRELEALAKHVALAIRKPTLYDRAVVDALTGLYTKRHFQEQVRQHIAQRMRLGTPLSLVILDVDHFKQVNDVHGHVAGDAVLAEVAKRVRGEIRGYDQAFRYGGEEVVILSPNTGLEDAVALAERLRERLRSERVETGEARIQVTASFGVSEFLPGSMSSPAEFLEAADQALYRAKRGGRDQVQVMTPVTATPELRAAA